MATDEPAPRSREQLERAAEDARAWLDRLDPTDPDVTVDEPAPPPGGWFRYPGGPYNPGPPMPEGWTPPRYRDYLRPGMEALPAEAPDLLEPPADAPSIVFVMLIDEIETAERLGGDWGYPDPPRRFWQASRQAPGITGLRGVLGEFEADSRDEAIAWAREQPHVEQILAYREDTQDLEQVYPGEPEILSGEVDLEREDVRDSRGRRIDAAYVERAVERRDDS